MLPVIGWTHIEVPTAECIQRSSLPPTTFGNDARAMRHLIRYLIAYVRYIIQEIRYIPSDYRAWKRDKAFRRKLDAIVRKHGL